MWKEIKEFEKLDVLRMNAGDPHSVEFIKPVIPIPNSHLIDFFRAVAQVPELPCESLHWRALDVDAMDCGLNRLQHLDIHTSPEDNDNNSDNLLLALLSQCRNILSLAWMKGLRFRRQQLSTRLSKRTEIIRRFDHGYWPHLRSLIIDGYLASQIWTL